MQKKIESQIVDVGVKNSVLVDDKNHTQGY